MCQPEQNPTKSRDPFRPQRVSHVISNSEYQVYIRLGVKELRDVFKRQVKREV